MRIERRFDETPDLPENNRRRKTDSARERNLEVHRKNFRRVPTDQPDALGGGRLLKEFDNIRSVVHASSSCYPDGNKRLDNPPPQLLQVVKKRHVRQHDSANNGGIPGEFLELSETTWQGTARQWCANIGCNGRHGLSPFD